MKSVIISCFNYYDVRAKKIINFFQENGCDVTYLFSNFDHHKKKHFNQKFKEFESFQISVPGYYKNLSIARLFSHMIFSIKVGRLLKDIKPDIIYCIIPPNTLVKESIKCKKKYKTKVILDLYDTWPESFPTNKYSLLFKYPFKIWKNIRDKYIQDTDMLITLSERDKKDAIKAYPQIGKINVLYPFLSVGNIPMYSFNIESQINICYLGNINYITDQELGIRLLGLLTNIKNVNLHIIGGGINLERFVELLKLERVNVICHGIIYEEEVKRSIFEQCSFGLNIPKEEIDSTMALKFIEYMKFGLPIINSGFGDNYEMLERYNIGINVNKNNINDTVEKITNFSHDDLVAMHNTTIDVYQKLFVNQDLYKVFQNLIS